MNSHLQVSFTQTCSIRSAVVLLNGVTDPNQLAVNRRVARDAVRELESVKSPLNYNMTQ